ncbi:MAG TPA: hypothetical protein PKI03_38230, partial [Pseudomonadota bacterium]|nr:hypothetical protein [Pseudomonadota bacterium]
IMSFDAKWNNDSFELLNTRVEALADPGSELANQLQDIARRCFQLFGMSGYARVDLRTDASGKLHVLELNANPCFWEGSSFGVACGLAGYNYAAVIDELIAAAERRQRISPNLPPAVHVVPPARVASSKASS